MHRRADGFRRGVGLAAGRAALCCSGKYRRLLRFPLRRPRYTDCGRRRNSGDSGRASTAPRFDGRARLLSSTISTSSTNACGPPSGACSAAFPTRRRASGSCRSRWKGSHRRSPRRPTHGAGDRLMDVEGARRLSSEIGSADKRLVAFEDPAKGDTALLARLLGPFARLRLDRAARMNGPRLRRRRREGE